MLRYILLIGVFLYFSINTIQACDACGCSLSQMYWGITPNNNLHYAGIWWQHQRYTSDFGSIEPLSTAASEEWFNTMELRVKYNLSPKIQLLSILPYQYHIRAGEAGQNTINGLGDISILGSYLVWQSRDSSNFNQKHQLRAGIGLKAPTGSFNAIDDETTINPNFQVGSGSWDVLFNLSYTARLANFGWNTDLTYRLNSTNSNDYRFGNRLNAAVNIYYTKSLAPLKIMPILGVLYEHADWDVKENYLRTHTGGHAWFGTAGLESYWKQYNLGVNYMLPIETEWANGTLSPESRWSIHLNWFF